MSKDRDYDEELRDLQIALIALQKHAIDKQWTLLAIFEGRDAAGKDGAIARITEHLHRRQTIVAALPKPSDREASEWYFQRYVEWLPACGEAGAQVGYERLQQAPSQAREVSSRHSLSPHSSRAWRLRRSGPPPARRAGCRAAARRASRHLAAAV